MQLSPEGLTTCGSIVEDELVALEAIYPDCISRRASEGGTLLKMELAIDLGGPRRVRIIDDGTNNVASGSESTVALQVAPSLAPLPVELSLSHLPPLILDLQLPSDYPLASPPTVLSAYFTYSWLPPKYVTLLMTRFHLLWQEQRTFSEGVLWRIAESIVTAEFLNDLQLVCSDNSISIPHAAPTIVGHQLTAYNTSIDDASFAITTFRCAICFEDRKGSACIRLTCEHVFCKDCLRDGWSLAVKEGDSSSVRCPDPECVAKTSQRARKTETALNDGEAGEDDVRRVLTEEEVARWKWLRVQRDIARDPTIVHCPLQFCQSPVPAPRNSSDHDGEDVGEYGIGWQKLRTCETCGFSFCIFCKKAWHGPITPCATRSGSTFVREYLDLPEDSLRRQLMERALGKKTLAKMIKQYEEDEQNRAWLESSTTRCPGCSVFCEKSHGCNHMTCVRCYMHYCFRCGNRVDPKDPYKHWSSKGAPCYNRLFDVQDTVDNPEEWEWGALVE